MNRVIIAILCLIGVVITHAETRQALVIGNSDYQHVTRLKNPASDADIMANALMKAGFAVDKRTNLTATGLREALRDFRGKLDDQSVAVIYYSGHGVQVAGENYLLPVDLQAKYAYEVEESALALGTVVKALEGAGVPMKIVFLDCCRDTGGLLPGEKKSLSRGMGEVKLEHDDTLVCFATKHGMTAADDNEKPNSNYTAAVAESILQPGLTLEQAMKEVARKVVAASNGEQRPWTYGSLLRDFVFVPGNGQPVLAKLDLPTGGAAMKPPPTTDKSTGLPASSLRVESTPSGLPFTVISMNSETERLQADLEDARTELADRKTEYAIKGLPAERNKYLKTRIGELEETTKRLESVVGNLPRVLSRLGSTPSALDSLPPGTYRVTVKQEGWPDQKQLVQVSASGGNVARAEFRGGSLKVTSEPRGATVSMDGKAVGTTPLELSSVIPGMKTLKVAKQGYSHKTLFANVQMGEPAIMSATLAKMNFDGTWRGSISGTSHNGNTDSPIAKSDHILRISGGGTHVTWTAIAPNGNDIVFVYTDCHVEGSKLVIERSETNAQYGFTSHDKQEFVLSEQGNTMTNSGSHFIRGGSLDGSRTTSSGTFHRSTE